MSRGTVPPPETVIANLRRSNEVLREELRLSSRAKGFRSFCRGMAVGGLLIGGAFVAGQAFGETIRIGGMHINGVGIEGTAVTIEPSPEPGQIAVVTMDNRMVNDASDNGEYFIGIPGLAVGVSFTWDADGYSGADKMTIRPPEGIECIPASCEADVMEGFTGSVILLDWVGM